MNNLQGFSTDFSPYEGSTLIGVLLFPEFSSTIVYSNEVNEPIVKEWVDREGTTDRYFTYQTTKRLLAAFIDGDISHYDLIMQCVGGVGFLQDVSKQDTSVFHITPPSELPTDYLPNRNFFFDEYDGVNINEISAYFNLKNIEAEPIDVKELKQVADESKSDIYNLHIKKGVGVGYVIKNKKTRAVNKYDDNILIETFNSVSAAAKSVKTSTTNISKACKNEKSKIKGFYWKYYI